LTALFLYRLQTSVDVALIKITVTPAARAQVNKTVDRLRCMIVVAERALCFHLRLSVYLNTFIHCLPFHTITYSKTTVQTFIKFYGLFGHNPGTDMLDFE